MKQSFQCYELQNGELWSHVFSPQERGLAVMCLHFENYGVKCVRRPIFAQLPTNPTSPFLISNTLLLTPQPCQSPQPPSL